MAIIKSYCLCHAPILIPEIGKGEEKKCQDTLDSYSAVAKEIKELHPDTIIISSPHMHLYSNCFTLASGYEGFASLSRFNAPELAFHEIYDEVLNKEILKEAERRDIPCYADEKQGKEFSLDHGSLVPLYFIEREYRDFKLVRIAISGLPFIAHYEMGMAISNAVSKLNRRAVYIASGDLSHCQKEDGPYGYKAAGPLYDKEIMDILGHHDFLRLLSYDPLKEEEAEVCGHPSFCMMSGTYEGKDVTSKVYSHEATFGVGYGIVSFSDAGKKAESIHSIYLQKEKKKIQNEIISGDDYVRLAREAINFFIKKGKFFKFEEKNYNADLCEKQAGVFVSVHEFSTLRGCIGTIRATENSIGEEIVRNAVAAVSSDPRFDKVKAGELPYLSISVDVLSPFERLNSIDELNPKIYGVYIRKDGRSGLLLPDLAGVNTAEEQIRIVKRKADIAPYERGVEYYRFTVIRHGGK